MKKITLNVDALQVSSFHTSAALLTEQGTVRGHIGGDMDALNADGTFFWPCQNPGTGLTWQFGNTCYAACGTDTQPDIIVK